jgi:predicted DNA-binding protein
MSLMFVTFAPATDPIFAISFTLTLPLVILLNYNSPVPITKSINLLRQTHVRLTPELRERMDVRSAEEGVRMRTWARGALLASLASSLPTMALKAAGGTEKQGEPLCLRLKGSDFKRLELAAKKAGVTTSVYLRAAFTHHLGVR